jgi:hypothetical protein
VVLQPPLALVIQIDLEAGRQWLTAIILATQETEIRRITVRSQPGQIVCETLSQKPYHKSGSGGQGQSAGGVALSSNPSTIKKKIFPGNPASTSGFSMACHLGSESYYDPLNLCTRQRLQHSSLFNNAARYNVSPTWEYRLRTPVAENLSFSSFILSLCSQGLGFYRHQPLPPRSHLGVFPA